MGWPFLIYFTNSIFEVQIGAKLERNWSKIGAFKRGFEIPSKTPPRVQTPEVDQNIVTVKLNACVFIPNHCGITVRQQIKK